MMAHSTQGGWHEWADANRMVVLHPRAGWSLSAGCWDWEGDTGEAFDTYVGAQLTTVVNMVKSLHERGVGALCPFSFLRETR